MIPLVAFLVVLAVGIPATGGHYRAIGRIHLKHETLILLLFIFQAVARGRLFVELQTARPWNPIWPWCVTVVALMVVLSGSFRVRGVPVVLAGLLLNLLPVMLNGYMPVSPSGVLAESTLAGLQQPGFYRVASGLTRLPVLGDVLPVPAVVGSASTAYVSAGDVCLMVGVAIVVLGASALAVERSLPAA